VTETDKQQRTEPTPAWPSFSDTDNTTQTPSDHYITRDGVEYAGTHLLVDFWQAQHLDNLELVEQALRNCAEAAGATLLHIHLHHFSDSGGISGVAVLAESHISVHTWPERSYAAFDIFMCGDTKPENGVDILKQAFSPQSSKIREILRGSEPPEGPTNSN